MKGNGKCAYKYWNSEQFVESKFFGHVRIVSDKKGAY